MPEGRWLNIPIAAVWLGFFVFLFAFYYFTLSAQIQAPIQRMYCVNAPAKVKKMALLVSSYSPGVYDGATAEFRDICNYWKVENMGFVSAKIDEQKTEETKQKVIELASKL